VQSTQKRKRRQTVKPDAALEKSVNKNFLAHCPNTRNQQSCFAGKNVVVSRDGVVARILSDLLEVGFPDRLDTADAA